MEFPDVIDCVCACVCVCVCLCVFCMYCVCTCVYVCVSLCGVIDKYSGKGLTCMGWKPCMSGSEYHCYPITTDSGWTGPL